MIEHLGCRTSSGHACPMIYGHSVENRSEGDWETLEAHASRVAKAARARADPFGGGHAAEVLGLFHDLGKAKPAFQRKLQGERNDVGHSGEGAKALNAMGNFGSVLAGVIAGHHGALPNPDRLRERIAAAETITPPDWCSAILAEPPPHIVKGRNQSLTYRVQFLVRMLYSCLTDADDRETGAFYDAVEGRARPARAEVLDNIMLAAFDSHMAALGGSGPVNELRREVLAFARAQAISKPGLFTMTVPTGGGKTLASLGFALDHALRHGLRRLVYVIPYTSIVEQTADVFRGVLGDEAVLEHHSAVDWSGVDETECEQRKIAAASWDVPVIVTTAVQFFESLHAARKKRCRKLHSLARSVIVMDEAQTMPLGLLRPCLAAMVELMEGYGASIVLSTATQPSLTSAGGFLAPEALEGARELAPDPPRLYERLKRVEVRDVGPMGDAMLTNRMQAAEQALLIVDNRVQARTLFDALRDLPGAAHLSTLMVPAHRRDVLARVRQGLKDGHPVRLVSTSLIEAGVDVSFPLVLRAAAGIDSIAQAAGRCNRHGEMDDLGRVEVFHSEHEAPPAVEQFAEIGRKVLATHGNDPIGQDAVAAYFKRLWDTYGPDALDTAVVGETARIDGILRAIETSGVGRCPFEDIEAAFRIVPGGQMTLAIRGGAYGIAPPALEDLRFRRPGTVARALQPHSINVPYRLWRQLWDAGAVEWWELDRFGDQFALLENENLYDENAGLSVTGFDDLGLMIG